MSLILASNSQIRRTMLKQAGLDFDVRSPDFDEDAAKQDGFEGEQLVRTLAEGKAASVAAGADDWVIGSDSGVVEHLGDAVVERAFIGAADVHARLLADGLEAFELAEF